MYQYLDFFDVLYDKECHPFTYGENLLYYVLYISHCKLELVLDVLQLLVDNSKLLLFVTPEENLYRLRHNMSIQQSYGIFSRTSYEYVFYELNKGGFQT